MPPQRVSKRKQKAIDYRNGIVKGKKLEKKNANEDGFGSYDEAFEYDRTLQQPVSKSNSEREKNPTVQKKAKANFGEQEKGFSKNISQQGIPVEITKNAQGKRYILFIGNLSYKVTTEILSKHFSVVGQSLSIRLPYTKTAPPRPKGYAFIEYRDSATLNKALKLHHTILQDRKINVELTGGGGGNCAARKNKLKQKNDKLNEERKKRIKNEEAEKAEKEKKVTETSEFVHPSRLSRFKA